MSGVDDEPTYTVSQNNGRPQINITANALEGFDVEPGDTVRVDTDGETLTVEAVEEDLPAFESKNDEHQMQELVYDREGYFERLRLYRDVDGDLWIQVGDCDGTWIAARDRQKLLEEL